MRQNREGTQRSGHILTLPRKTWRSLIFAWPWASDRILSMPGLAIGRKYVASPPPAHPWRRIRISALAFFRNLGRNGMAVVQSVRSYCTPGRSDSMPITVEAIYENGVLKPAQPLPFEEREKVVLTVQSTTARRTTGVIP